MLCLGSLPDSLDSLERLLMFYLINECLCTELDFYCQKCLVYISTNGSRGGYFGAEPVLFHKSRLHRWYDVKRLLTFESRTKLIRREC